MNGFNRRTGVTPSAVVAGLPHQRRGRTFPIRGAGKSRTLAPRRERGELGQGWLRAARSAAWMPFIETGQSPGTNSAENLDGVGAQVVTLAGSCFCPGSALMGRPMMGSEGPWSSKLTARGTPNDVSVPLGHSAIAADLTVPVVRAAVARQAVTAPRAQSATPP